MYYKQSLSILKRIKSAKNILVNVHKNPDFDSIGSACALAQSFGGLKKKITIVASEKVDDSLLIFPVAKKIKVIDYAVFDFSKYDLFIVVDSSSYDRVTGSKKISLPKMQTVVIDHHYFNTIIGAIKLVDTDAPATCEIIYKLFDDWKINIDKNVATMLYSGVVGDTVFFKYSENISRAVSAAAKLLAKNADHQYLINAFYDSMDFGFVRLMGLFLQKIKIEKTKSGQQFVWAAVDNKQFIEYGQIKGAREASADSFFRSIKNVDFGLSIIESKKGVLNISFRSKSFGFGAHKPVDVAILAKSFGGGGHVHAAGATLEGEFDKTVKNIIEKIVATAHS